MPRPTVDMMRGSGMIEAEADVCLILWRDRDEDGNRNPGGKSEFYVGKMRDDEVDYSVPLHFDGNSMTFRDAADGFKHPVEEAEQPQLGGINDPITNKEPDSA